MGDDSQLDTALPIDKLQGRSSNQPTGEDTTTTSNTNISHQVEGKQLLSLSVDFGHGKVDVLKFFQDVDAAALAHEFVVKHGIQGDPYAFSDVKANIEATVAADISTAPESSLHNGSDMLHEASKPYTNVDILAIESLHEPHDALDALFRQCDASGDGHLAKHELSSLLSELGLDASEHEVNEMVAELLPLPAQREHGVSLDLLRKLLD